MVNGFVQYRVRDKSAGFVNANNLFNKLAIIETQETALAGIRHRPGAHGERSHGVRIGSVRLLT
ncbi:MAG: hypothetical protein QM756_20290 [Polyangiaceae bacterium]